MTSLSPNAEARSRLCLALDTGDLGEAVRLAKSVEPHFGWVKVGLELFTAHGPRAIESVRGLGLDVFLDLKLHDIPNTVASAAREISNLGASMLNVHCLGGEEMIRWAVDAVRETSAGFRRSPPKVVGVTLLTSLDQQFVASVLGYPGTIDQLVISLGSLARTAGADGVVASALELRALKREFGASFVVVTPGVTLDDGAAPADQRRTTTVSHAIADGADLVVIGRAVSRSSDPQDAAGRAHDAAASEISRLRST